MTRADLDYALEARSYILMEHHLEEGSISDRVVPQYYDAWTFAVETHIPERLRLVRMVLLERVTGDTMEDIILQKQDVGKEECRSVLTRVIDAE